MKGLSEHRRPPGFRAQGAEGVRMGVGGGCFCFCLCRAGLGEEQDLWPFAPETCAGGGGA
jgi:hypothetical protein